MYIVTRGEINMNKENVTKIMKGSKYRLRCDGGGGEYGGGGGGGGGDGGGGGGGRKI